MTGKLRSLLLGRGANVDKGTFAASAERLRRQGQLAEAVELCREGLNAYPDQLSARVTLGRALMDLEQFDEARVELEYVVKRAPDNLAAIRGLAELHDRSESAALLVMEGAGDWPPRQEDIERAVSNNATAHAASAAGPESARASHEIVPMEADSASSSASESASIVREPIPRSAVELLEEAEALEALADQAEMDREPGTVELDDTDNVDLEEIASELVVPTAADALASDDGFGPVDHQEPAALPGDAEPIVLDADSLGADLDEIVALDAGSPEPSDPKDDARNPSGSDDDPGGTPPTQTQEVATESALDALERLLDRVKNRRQQVAGDSAA